MSTLESVIRMEYGSDMIGDNEDAEKVLGMASEVFDGKQLEEFVNLLMNTKYFMFQQGFIRGIAAEMAGVV